VTITPERWRPIPGHEDAYLVSDKGTVYSLPRTVRSVNRWGEYSRTVGGCFKTIRRGQVALCRGGGIKYVSVARLVAAVFSAHHDERRAS
jgi:NUMOD4 motif